VFGRRKVPLGGSPAAPPPPSGKEPFPIEKMDRALDGAIRLFTRALDGAGTDAGALAIRGDVPAGVTQALADCTTYRGEEDGGLTFLVLGLTNDFKAFMYPPHCRLFMIINSTGICEDPAAAGILNTLAPEQFPSPMIDAHLMRRWIHHILPTNDALRGGQQALHAFQERIMADLMDVLNSVPRDWASRIDLKSMFMEWSGGFPGTIGRPLTDDVPRMNGLPMTPFIADTLTKFLAELQMRGISERR